MTGRRKGKEPRRGRVRRHARKGKKDMPWMDKDDKAFVDRMAWRQAFECAWRVTCQADAERLAGEAFEAACEEFQELADMPRWSGAKEYFCRVFSEMFGEGEERSER